MEDEERTHLLLTKYYNEVHDGILAYQSHTLGLFPRGMTQHARVKDNVYCASVLWALSLAYRRVNYDRGRTYELEQSAVKCMRGLLFCWMRQADKVEKFKNHQLWEDALHARFDYVTGDQVTKDSEWGHLQIDSTSLFLLMMAQMTESGVQVVFTLDEVDFVQNLVYYVERAYRIPDFGMWERGSRDNIGKRELHASSIGMAKAALEAMNGLNLFGENGSPLSTIHVDPDAHYRNSVILNTLLPKESNSKETDASLLLLTGFPAFVINNSSLCKKTEDKVKEMLEGKYGFKRFIRDGHHTVKEKKEQKYYDPSELSHFEGIECEWPLFFAYLVVTELCRGNKSEAAKYWKMLESSVIEENGRVLLPRLYFVPESELDRDDTTIGGSMCTFRDLEPRLEPMREEGHPFLWAQALYLLARLMWDGLLTPDELDPLALRLSRRTRSHGISRRLGFKAPVYDTMIQVALIAETTSLQVILATYGIPTQTQRQVHPIKIRAPQDILMKAFSHVGENHKLGLSGRPNRPIGALATGKVYKIFGHTTVFYPTDSVHDFYISFDTLFLINVLKSTIQFLNLNWNMGGRPMLCLYLTESTLKGRNFYDFIHFLSQLKQGEVDGVKVRLDRLQALISTSCTENLEYTVTDESVHLSLLSPLRSKSVALSSSVSYADSSVSLFNGADQQQQHDNLFADTYDFLRMEEEEDEETEPTFSHAELKTFSNHQLLSSLKKESNLLGQLYLLHELMKRGETHFTIHGTITISDKVEEIYSCAGEKKHWMAARFASSILRKEVDCLAPSVTNMLCRGKEVTIGVFGRMEHIISEPMSPKQIVTIIYDCCMPHNPIEAVLQQELIIYLGDYITNDHHKWVFEGMTRLRIGWIIQAMQNEFQRNNNDQVVYQLAPHEVNDLMIKVLKGTHQHRSPLSKRQLEGALNRVPSDFYIKIFKILDRIGSDITVRNKTLSRLPTIYEMSPHEKSFALQVEELLSSISLPEYRQLIVELLVVVSTVLERNPELNHEGGLDLDELLQDSFDLHSQDCKSKADNSCDGSVQSKHDHAHDRSTDDDVSNSFYQLNPDGVCSSTSYMARAVVNRLLSGGLHYDTNKCVIS